MMQARNFDWLSAGALSLFSLTTGCAGEKLQVVEEGVAHQTTAIFNTDFKDATGTIEVRVKTCDIIPPLSQPAQAFNCAYCTIEVDEGWALVGGGAQIIGESTPGAMLQSSFPSPNFFTRANAFGCSGPASPSGQTRTGFDDQATWVVRSAGANHRVQAYVIGLRIRDTPTSPPIRPETTIGIDSVTSAVNPPANYSVETSESRLPSGFIIVGGGANIINHDDISLVADAYLTESRLIENGLEGGRAWRASARAQHNPAQDNPLKTYAIGVAGCPAWSNNDCFVYPSLHNVADIARSGYGTASYTGAASWVVTSIGGSSPRTSGAGRYLADLIPFNGSQKGLTVRSKSNDLLAATGPTNGSAVLLGRFQAPYLFNAVRFNVAGTALFRPSGTDPRLQQSTLFPDAPALRWHLEHLGSGVYRLRNGNPDAGTECAYWSSATSAVRVKACGTGNEFKWTLFSGALNSGTFVLRNVATNTCLDNNNQGWANTNLILRTCSSGSEAQALFLDAFNVPPP